MPLPTLAVHVSELPPPLRLLSSDDPLNRGEEPNLSLSPCLSASIVFCSEVNLSNRRDSNSSTTFC